MPVQITRRYVAICDVCREPLQYVDDETEYTLHFPTRQEAQESAVLDSEWTDLGRGRLGCRKSDPAHDDARDAAALRRAA